MTPYYTIRTAAIHASSRVIQRMSLAEKNVALRQQMVERGPLAVTWMPRNHEELTGLFFLNTLLPHVGRGPYAANDVVYDELPPEGDQA